MGCANPFTDLLNFFHPPTYYEESINTDLLPEKHVTSGRNLLVFDPKKLVWALYNREGHRVGMGKASGGKDYCADLHRSCRTVEGEFTVFRTEDKDCTSQTFPLDEGGGAPMPHCMFFHQGYAIHGYKNVGDANLSHGCIRVTEKAAEWMNKNYMHPGSLVIVESYTG